MASHRVLMRTIGLGGLLSIGSILAGPSRGLAQIPGIPTTWPLPLPIPTAAPSPASPPTGGGTTADYALGFEPLDPSVYLKLAESFAPAMGNLPSSSDMSGDFPPVGDQGAQGSCVAWAVGYALKSFQEHDERGWSYSNEHLFSPAFIFNNFKKGKCSGGLYVNDALEFVSSSGIAPLSGMPYNPSDCSAMATDALKTTAKQYRVHSIKRVDKDIVEIKGHLAARMPVVVGMRIDASFSKIGSTVWNGMVGAPRGGHAMVIVGYDDTRQAFRLFNSWGKGWGDKGLGWVSYTALVKHADELYIARDFNSETKPTPNPSPTPAPKPSYGSPKVTLSAPTTMKNILVGDTYYFGIAVAGTIDNAAGRKYQLVVRFRRNGKPIVSKDPKYADAHGDLAAGTPKAPIVTASFPLGGAPSIAVPQMSLKNSLGSVPGEKVTVEIQYDVYVDGFHVGRSVPGNVTLVWN